MDNRMGYSTTSDLEAFPNYKLSWISDNEEAPEKVILYNEDADEEWISISKSYSVDLERIP